jgi:hypothetical protein
VAKRNFAKRHRHLGKIPPSDLPHDFDDSCDDDLSTSEQELVTAATETCNNAVGASKPKAANNATSEKQKTYRCDAQELLDELVSRNAKEVRQNDPIYEALTDDMVETLLNKRREKWNSLLMKRPKTKKGMITWTQEILRLSEMFDEESPAAATIPTTTINSHINKKTKNQSEQQPTTTLLDGGKKKNDDDTNKKDTKDESTSLHLKRKVDDELGVGDDMEEEEEEEQGEIVEKGKDDDDDDEVEAEVVPDDATTSSEDSVDLRASKKARSRDFIYT